MNTDSDAFVITYRAHLSYVSALIRRLGVPEAEVDDVCQEVFLVVHRRLREFEGRSSMRTWLFSIVHHVTFAWRRGNARRNRKRDQISLSELESVTDPAEVPEESAAQRQQLDLVKELLTCLDEEKRALLLLVDVQELNVAEAAEHLGLNANTASSRLRAGRQQMSAALARHRARAQMPVLALNLSSRDR